MPKSKFKRKTGFFIGLYDRGLGKENREEIIRKQS